MEAIEIKCNIIENKNILLTLHFTMFFKTVKKSTYLPTIMKGDMKLIIKNNPFYRINNNKIKSKMDLSKIVNLDVKNCLMETIASFRKEH